MPKYIKKRKRGERIEHQFFYGIEHKTCSCCNEWLPLDKFGKKAQAWDKKNHCCKSCKKKRYKQRKEVASEKRKKEREAAPSGFSVCLNPTCTVKKWLQPVDQFISPFVRDDEPTMHCLTCRDKQKEADKRRQASCLEVYQNWRKTHPCVKCMNDPNYEHNYLLIEADHLGGKVVNCSNLGFWSHSQRGPRLQKAELKKCQALCKFHHALVTKQRDHDKGKIQKQASILRKRAIINAEKHKRGCCLRCERVLKKGEERGFEFDHRDASTKFKYRGKHKSPSDFVHLPDALFDTQWPLEQAKCDLLCANCHKVKPGGNRDGYRN